MKQDKDVKISYWAAHLTTIVSVTLVLVILGIIAMISIGASEETRRLRERLEVSVVMSDSVRNESAQLLSEKISHEDYALKVDVITKEEALRIWKEETGEDLEALFGVNPLSPEVTFTVKSEYAEDKELKRIGDTLRSYPGVETVALPDSSMVENMNRNIERFALILGGIAVVMIIISFVLINNTVHLAVYARRFTIHTMQLVGATDGFIRRPYVCNNMISGIIAGIVGGGILGAFLAAAPGAGFGEISGFISWSTFAAVAVGMALTGMLLCGIAAWIATTRYLHQDYEKLFK